MANREFPIPDFNVTTLTVYGNITATSSYTVLGSGSSSHALGAGGDLLVSGKLEVTGNAWCDSSLTVGGASAAAQLSINSNVTGQLSFVPRNADSIQLVVYNGTNQSGNNLVLCGETGLGKAFDHGTSTDPHLWVHSETDPDSDNTEYVGIWHDQTDGHLDIGKGNLVIDSGDVVLGANSSAQGTLTLWDGSGGNTPGWIALGSPNGTVHYLFIEDDGTVKQHTSAPTANTDGNVVGAQT